MKFFSTLLAGILFGTGLVITRMADPAKVQNFLDIFGRWDSSLAFVMGGVITATMLGFWLVRKRATPFFSDAFHLPQPSDYEAHLVVGAVIFGYWLGIWWVLPWTHN